MNRLLAPPSSNRSAVEQNLLYAPRPLHNTAASDPVVVQVVGAGSEMKGGKTRPETTAVRSYVDVRIIPPSDGLKLAPVLACQWKSNARIRRRSHVGATCLTEAGIESILGGAERADSKEWCAAVPAKPPRTVLMRVAVRAGYRSTKLGRRRSRATIVRGHALLNHKLQFIGSENAGLVKF